MTPVMAEAPNLPDGFEIDLAVEAGGWPDEESLESWCQAAVGTGLARGGLKASVPAELSIVFADDARVQELNRAWRDKDKPTNVLSFPGGEPNGDVYGPLLGDIILAFETVEKERLDLGVSFRDHCTHLVVHGLLHLFGYDHQDDAEAEEMEDLERGILAELGIADPYLEAPLKADGD